MTTPDVFLSYNREDVAVAKLFADAFAHEGLEVWWDQTLRSGETYDEVTKTALRGAKVVVVLWSPRSVASQWVRAEATIAHRAKTLVPATIEACDRPVMFELTQTAELSHWRGEPTDQAWQSFIVDVRRMLGTNAPRAPAASLAIAQQPALGMKLPLVAVLPLVSRVGDDDMDLLAEDLTEEITRELARNFCFEVIAAGTMAAWRGKMIDHRGLGRELQASYLVEGKLQRSGDKVRLTVQLIDGVTGGMLHSARHIMTAVELEELPEEFAAAIASEIGEYITQFEARRAIEKQGPLTGWDHFMRAVAVMERLEPESITRAIDEARQAVAKAPELGLAHALAARIIGTRISLNGPDESLRREIHDHIRLAMQLDGNNPIILHYVVGAYINLVDAGAALRLARRAVELNPNSPRSRFALGQALYMSDRNAEAIAEFREQLRIAPHDLNRPHALLHLGVCLCIEGKPNEAEVELDRALALHPDSGLALVIKSIALALQGREEAAVLLVKQMREIATGYTFDQHLHIISLLLRSLSEEGVAIFRRLWAVTEPQP